MSKYDELVKRFDGERPDIKCWSPTEYRVTYARWHEHDGAASGAPCADDKTLEAACARLLEHLKEDHVELVPGTCDSRCYSEYQGSEKAKLAHERLRKFIKTRAAEAERLPHWKRGLPPCANCDLAYGHKGECEV